MIGGHLPGGGRACAEGGIIGTLYLLSVTLTRFFDEFDLARAESIFPAARFARRIIPVA